MKKLFLPSEEKQEYYLKWFSIDLTGDPKAPLLEPKPFSFIEHKKQKRNHSQQRNKEITSLVDEIRGSSVY